VDGKMIPIQSHKTASLSLTFLEINGIHIHHLKTESLLRKNKIFLYFCIFAYVSKRQLKFEKYMFNNLSEKLDKALHVLKGHGSITEVNVAETLKEVRRALLDADVNFKIAKDFTTSVKEKAIGQNVLTTLQPGQLMVKIVKDELTQLMGGDAAGINLSGTPSVTRIW
jgi:signal recognition particle GTPase